MRKRLRKKLRRRRPAALGLIAPGVLIRDVDMSPFVPAIRVGPEHQGKKGSAKERYRLRRWHRRNPLALWGPPPSPGVLINHAVLISSQSELEAIFGRLPRRLEPLFLIGDGGSVLPLLPEDNVIGKALDQNKLCEMLYKDFTKEPNRG